MEDKEAARILLALLQKDHLTDEERRAVRVAVGVLGWTSLAEGRLKTMRARREQRFKKME
jgi:hypothetical protein